MFFDIALPVLFAAFVWWFGTGLIIYLDGMNRRSYRWSMLGATVLLAAAVAGIHHFSSIPTVAGAAISFVCGVLVWGWVEMSFLMGYITGSRRSPCPPESRGLSRIRYAIEAILYHEIAIILLGLGLMWMTWGDVNPTGTWTFFLLWGMRLSAKLNLFLGVRNQGVEFLPDQLKYLATYFSSRPINLFFPVSMGAAYGILVLLITAMSAPGATSFQITAHALLAALMGLAILEHVFMMVPFHLTSIWGWSFKSRSAAADDQPEKIHKTPAVTSVGNPAIGGQHEL